MFFDRFPVKAPSLKKNIQDAVEAIKIALLEADVNLRVVRRFVNYTIEEALGEKVLRSVDPGQQFIKIVSRPNGYYAGIRDRRAAAEGS